MTYQPTNTLEPPLNENISFSEEWDDFSELNTRWNREIARKVNKKDQGYYLDQEILNDQKFFDAANRQQLQAIFRKVVDCGALPDTATKQVAHGIVGIGNAWMFTRIYGTAREPAGVAPRPYFIPIPNVGAYQVEIMVDTTNINITTVANLSAFTQTYVVLEYWKA